MIFKKIILLFLINSIPLLNIPTCKNSLLVKPTSNVITVHKDGKTISKYPKTTDTQVITFTQGPGLYTVCVGFNKYLINVSEVDYTHSNSMVNLEANPKTCQLADDLYAQDSTNFINNCTEYVHNNIEYSKKDFIESDYISKPDEVFKRGYGVCIDYATAECVMLRHKKVPCKLIVGKLGSELHSWCRVQIDGKWVDIDPTIIDDVEKSAKYEY